MITFYLLVRWILIGQSFYCSSAGKKIFWKWYCYSCGVDISILNELEWLLKLYIYHYSFCPQCQQVYFSVFTFISAYSELTGIKMLTSIILAFSLHVCKPWCKRVLVWYPLARLHGLKLKYFQHWDITNCPAPFRKRTEPWHHCVVLNRTVNFVNRYTPT